MNGDRQQSDSGYGSEAVAWAQAKEELKYMTPCESEPPRSIFIPKAGITIRVRTNGKYRSHDWRCSCGATGMREIRFDAVDDAFIHAMAKHKMDKDDHRSPLVDDGISDRYQKLGKPPGW